MKTLSFYISSDYICVVPYPLKQKPDKGVPQAIHDVPGRSANQQGFALSAWPKTINFSSNLLAKLLRSYCARGPSEVMKG